MTYDDLLNNWLEPATDIKKKNSRSKSGNRVVLGAKGVGRFASASLGRSIYLASIARVDGKLKKSVLELDWDIFENTEYLDQIDIDVQEENCSQSEKTGVLIKIRSLSTIWDKKRLSKLVRELRRLATPTSNENKFDIFLYLNDFKASLAAPYNFDGKQLLLDSNKMAGALQKKGSYIENSNLILPYSISDESDYHLKGKFTKDGDFSGVFTIVRGDKTPIEINLPAHKLEVGKQNCGEVNVDLKIYDLESDSIEKLFSRMGLNFSDFGLRKAREIISENSGVAIYRAGFRIRPYGEPDMDWLKLEKRRINNPSKRIGHGQISGSIHVSTEEASHLIERSSREGLESNSAFERLIDLLTNLLVKIEQKRFDFREKAGLSRKPSKSIDKARGIASLDSISQAISALPTDQQKPLLLKVEKESRALTKTLDEIDAYQKLLESRAALGMVVGQVIHDGRTYLEPINSSAKSIIKNAPFLLDNNSKGDLVRKYYPTYGQAILTGAKGLSSLFKSLDPISGRRRGKPSNFCIKDVIDNSLNLLEEQLIENDVNKVVDVDKNIAAYGYNGDLQSALINILQNAIHWLSVSSLKAKEIMIKGKVESNYVQILVENNGPLIDEADMDSIFEAGFSLKSNGHGLGLAIAKEACKNSNGDLWLSSESANTCFVIDFPLEVNS
jgi:signal transduction histidine kinase